MGPFDWAAFGSSCGTTLVELKLFVIKQLGKKEQFHC
jgi:hypothetical protein